jgi:hypothetical protein
MQVDVSKNMGNNWVTNQKIWDGIGGSKAHYPRTCGIYNPAGNTNPNNTHCVFTASVITGANDIWGGIALGNVRLNLQQTDSTLLTATAASKFALGDGVALTQNTAYVLQDETDYANNNTYLGNYSIFRGVWNGATTSFDWSANAPTPTVPQGYIKIPVAQTKATADKKIAFSQTNPNIGYIAAITNTSTTTTHYQLLILKTTDGGTTWNNAAPFVLDVSGIGNSHFGTTNRLYATGFELDAAVDSSQNLDIIIAIAPAAATPYTLNTPQGTWGIFHINTDGNALIKAKILAKPNTFRGIYNNLSNDNRPQISKDASGSHTFFSWLDSDTTLLGTQNNIVPNIQMRAMRHHDQQYNKATNGDTILHLTRNTDADALCNFGMVTDYVFETTNATTNAPEFEIPAVFQSWGGDEGAPIAWFYINNATLDKNTLFSNNVSHHDLTQNSVSIYPNPAQNTINVQTDNVNSKVIYIKNNLGQVVLQQTYNAPTTQINVEKLPKSIYLLCVDGMNFKIIKN